MQVQHHEHSCCGGRHHHAHQGHEHGGCASLFPRVDGPLSAEAHAAVLEALDDEYRARAFYLAVLKRFPDASPFAHIVEAEERHALALTSVLDAYGLAIPPNPHLGDAEILRNVPGSLACACDMAVAEEQHNDRLYAEKLLPKVAAFPHVTQVFERLMLATRQCHLPTFERYAAAYRTHE